MTDNWNYFQNPVNFILLGDPMQISPGIATLAGAGSPRDWEVRKGYGYAGAMLWFKGRGLAKFTVTLRFYNEADLAGWHAWKSLVQALPFGRRERYLPIWHPELAELEIDKVVVTNLHQLEQSDDGVWSVKIDFMQHRRWRLSLSKPGTPSPEKKDRFDRELERNTRQIEALLERARQ
jgi:hypothetical protein